MKLDMYVKHILRIKYYVRYMDDFILLVRDKEEARKVYEKIKFFLNEKVKIRIKF
jgi:RNA-directed DNA polymerase